MPAPRVDVVVLNYNGKRLLEAGLPSVFAQRYERFKVMLVDNGSTDSSAAFVRERWPQARIVALPDNVGITAALNRGVEAGDAPYVALLNNDVELHPAWAGELVAVLEEDPGAGSATGKLLSFFERDIIDGAGDMVSWSGACIRRGRGERDRGQYDVPGTVFSASGAAALYRRAALEAVGPFDEDFYAYLEDVDWGFRAQLAGFTCRYVPSSVAYHMGGGTTGEDTDGFYRALLWRNGVTLVLKNYPASRLARHAHQVLGFQLAHFLVSVREGRARRHVGSWAAALRGLPSTLRKRRRIQASRRVSTSYLESVVSPRRGYCASIPGVRGLVRVASRARRS